MKMDGFVKVSEEVEIGESCLHIKRSVCKINATLINIV